MTNRRSKIRCPHCESRLLNTDTLLMHLKRRHPAEWTKETGQKPWPERICRVYLRVSADHQSTEIQRRKIAAYLALRGVPDNQIHWYEDHGITGTTMERESLIRLLGDLNAGDVFVLTHPDRLARKTVDFMTLTMAIKARRADIYAIDCPIDTTDAWGNAFWGIMGIFAQLEWTRIVERTMDGQEKARALGVKTGRHRAGCGSHFPCPNGIHTPLSPVAAKSRPEQTALSPENTLQEAEAE